MARHSAAAVKEAQKRLAALETALDGEGRRVRDLEDDAARGLATFNEIFPASDREDGSSLRIRRVFNYLTKSAPVGDDRKAPAKKHRPPAGKVTASRGITLQLLLVMIAGRQASTKAVMDSITVAGNAESPAGWSDLVATGAVNSGNGSSFVTRRDKRLSSVRSAVSRLQSERFISIDGKLRSSQQVVTLLKEAPPGPGDDVVEYRPPKDRVPGDGYFTLPWSFIRQGWVFILRDSELLVLLMLANGLGRLSSGGDDVALGEIAIPGDVRLGHYGIHRDPFALAYANLERFGLIEVRAMKRYESGRAVDGRIQLHRFKLLMDAFNRPAFDSARSGLRDFVTLGA